MLAMLAMLRIEYPHFRKMDQEFQDACAAGDLAGAQAIAARPGFVRATAVADDNGAFHWACYRGHLAVVQWLHTMFELTWTIDGGKP